MKKLLNFKWEHIISTLVLILAIYMAYITAYAEFNSLLLFLFITVLFGLSIGLNIACKKIREDFKKYLL